MIIQCVPVEANSIENFKKNFEIGVRAHNLDFFILNSDEKIDDFLNKNEFYFYLEVFNNVKNRFDKYLCIILEK